MYLGWIKGTNLRANALGPDGAKIGSKHYKHSSRAIELGDCTSKIILGIERNKKTIFIPYFLKFIPWARVFFKNWLFNKIVSVTKQEER